MQVIIAPGGPNACTMRSSILQFAKPHARAAGRRSCTHRPRAARTARLHFADVALSTDQSGGHPIHSACGTCSTIAPSSQRRVGHPLPVKKCAGFCGAPINTAEFRPRSISASNKLKSSARPTPRSWCSGET